MDNKIFINANDLIDAAKDHYWDSLEPERRTIIKHIEGIVASFAEYASEQAVKTGLAKLRANLKDLPPEFSKKDLIDAALEEIAIGAEYASEQAVKTGLAKLRANLKDLPPEFSKAVDDNFWDLI